MTIRLRKVSFVAAAAALAAAGCATLSGDPLSPPHVRHASCATQNVGQALEEKMSPEYQEWWAEVKHFGRDTQREIEDDYHKNAYWPRPFDTHAQHSVRQPHDLQAENARQQLATLWDYHFETGTGKLNSMGRKRLQDIVGQSGTLGHTVFVQRLPSTDETSLRVDDVRTALDEMDLDEMTFEVAQARSNPSVVSGDEAKAAIKLMSEPKKKEAAGTQSGAASGYNNSGTQ
jgi:hypothetical protein